MITVEPAAFAVSLAEALRRSGVPVAPERAGRLAAALPLVPPDRRSTLYWTARVTLVADAGQLATFDRVFATVFDGRLDPADTRGDTGRPPAVLARAGPRPPAPGSRPTTAPGAAAGGNERPRPARPGDDADTSAEREAIAAAASRTERLAVTSFAELAPDEVAELRRLVGRIAMATPTRRSRRTRPSARRGERVDLRRTLRSARRSGGDPVRIIRRRRRVRPRPLVLLCDVSASMEPYTRVFVALLQGAVAGVRAEAFVFATRLTRLTRPLAGRDPDESLARAAQAAPDWAGGTRLGENLRRFLDEHGRRGIARGAVVVILSDGWEQDDPRQLGEQMARLRRLAYRIVWVNPRKAAAGFAPLAGGMAAALPYCDAFVSGHSLVALTEVAAAVGATGSTRRRDT